MSRFEKPVAGSDPSGHGPGTEVRVLSGLIRQLQTHGGNIHLANRNNTSVNNPNTPHSEWTSNNSKAFFLFRDIKYNTKYNSS